MLFGLPFAWPKINNLCTEYKSQSSSSCLRIIIHFTRWTTCLFQQRSYKNDYEVDDVEFENAVGSEVDDVEFNEGSEVDDVEFDEESGVDVALDDDVDVEVADINRIDDPWRSCHSDRRRSQMKRESGVVLQAA